jgi:hypothetical protein
MLPRSFQTINPIEDLEHFCIAVIRESVELLRQLLRLVLDFNDRAATIASDYAFRRLLGARV